MACKTTYLATNGRTSELYTNLVERYGQTQGEIMYLNSKSFDWHPSVLNFQNEPSLEALISGNPDIKQLQKRSDKEIVKNINSTAPNVDFNEDAHEYRVNGVLLESTSRKVDKDVPYTGLQTVYNYAEEGTRTHAIFEDIVNHTSIEDINAKHNIVGHEIKMVADIRALVAKLEKRGKLIPEIRMANTAEGYAGTVDLLLIKPNGRAEVYDIKTAYETPKVKAKNLQPWSIYETSQGIPNYKARRYSLQTLYYKDLVETSDPDTGRIGVPVDDVFIIPIEVFGIEGDWNKVKVNTPENINTWKSGKIEFDKDSEKIIAQEKLRSQGKGELVGAEISSDIDSFVDIVLPKSKMNSVQLTNTSKQIVANFGHLSSFKYKDLVHYWKNENDEERLLQIQNVINSEDKDSDAYLVNSAVRTLNNNEPQGIFLKDDNALNQLKQLYTLSGAKHVFALNSINGFEKYNDVLVFQRGNGTIELVKMTKDNLSFQSEVKNANSKYSKKYANAPDSIVGNYMTSLQAKNKGITLNNSMEDREKLRLATIAMELKASNPDMKVDRLMVHSYAGRHMTVPVPILLSDVIPQVKIISEIPDINKSLSENNKKLLENEESYNVENLAIDPVAEMLDYFDVTMNNDDFINETTGKANTRGYIRDRMRRYDRNEIAKDELIETLISGDYGLRKLIYNKYAGLSDSEMQDAVLKDPEFMKLANVMLTLLDTKLYPEKDITDEMLGKINMFLTSPTKTGKRTLDDAIDYGRKFNDNVRQSLHKFNIEKKGIFEKLRTNSTMLNKGIKMREHVVNPNTIFAMGTDAYLPLIKTKTDAKGNSYYTPFLLEEGSTEFNNLNKAQQDTIKWLNKKFSDVYRLAHPNKNKDGSFESTWPKGMIPVMTSRPNDYMYKAKDKLRQGKFKQSAKMFFKRWSRAIDLSRGAYDYRPPEKTNHRTKIFDHFEGQVVGYNGTIQQSALNQMGLNSNMELENVDLNNNFELDLDTIVTNFAEHYYRKTEYEKALPVLTMYKSIFNMYESLYFMKQDGNIAMLDAWIEDIYFGEKQIFSEGVDKFMGTAASMSSHLLFGLNWKTMSLNGLQGSMSILANAATNSMTGNPDYPGMKDFAKANKVIIEMANPLSDKATLVDLITQAYLVEDLTQLKSKRFKPLHTGMLNSQTMFIGDRMIETSLRSFYLVAQMIKDGTFDAHQVGVKIDKNGNEVKYLVYNESQDARFKNDKKYKDAVKQGLIDKGEGIGKDGQMLLAYDYRLRQRIKAFSDSMIPSADKDTSTHAKRFGILAGGLQTRSWITEFYNKATTREYPNKNIGDYKSVPGQDNLVWTENVYKGMWRTYADIPRYINEALVTRNYKYWSEVPEVDRRNIIFTFNSLLMFTTMALASAAVMGGLDDEEKEKRKLLTYMFDRALADIMVPLTLGPIYGVFEDPMVFVSHFKRLFNVSSKAISFGLEGDIEQSWDEIKSVTPLIKDLQF